MLLCKMELLGEATNRARNFRGLLKCGEISHIRGINFHDLDTNLHTTCTGTTKYLIFVDKMPAKSTTFIPQKSPVLQWL